MKKIPEKTIKQDIKTIGLNFRKIRALDSKKDKKNIFFFN